MQTGTELTLIKGYLKIKSGRKHVTGNKKRTAQFGAPL